MARVALINSAKVNTNTLSDIVVEADLPSGEIRLVVGDPLLSEDYQGVTIARDFASLAQNLWGLDQYMDQPWDCGVVIGQKWAAKQPDLPAYFAYLLGHELGHAKTILTNLALAVYEDVVLRYMPKVSPERKWRWDDMPHEVRYDQFGLAISEALYGRARLEEEIHRILSDGLTEGKLRLQKTLDLQPSKDLRGLWAELAQFALPYRDRLLELWKQDRHLGRLRIADGVLDLDTLWSASSRTRP